MVHRPLVHRQIAVSEKNSTVSVVPTTAVPPPPSTSTQAEAQKTQTSAPIPPVQSTSPTALPAISLSHALPNPAGTTSLSIPKDVMLSNGTETAAGSSKTTSASSVAPSSSSSSSSFIKAEDVTNEISQIIAIQTSAPATPPPTPTPTPRASGSISTLMPIGYTTPPPHSTSSPYAGHRSDSLSQEALIGIIVAGCVVPLLLLGLCVGCGMRMRRSKRTHTVLDDMPAPRAAEYPHPIRPMTTVTLPEARDSVYNRQELVRDEFAPPMRTHAAFAPRMSRATSAWTDHSDADAFAHDGSTIARTLSTVSRPNSEYDLENDPGATFRACPGTPGTFGLPASSSYGPYTHSVVNSLDLGPSVNGGYGVTSGYTTNSGYSSSGYQSPGPYATYQSSSLAGPSYVPQPQPQPLPTPVPQPQPAAPRLLVDTKRSLAENPNSPFYEGPQPSSGPSHAQGYQQIRSPISPTEGTHGASSMGTMSARPLTSPISPTTPGGYTSTQEGTGSGLQRGPTIIRHADAGAFADAVPDNEAEVHLPPAYGDIYGPPAA